MKSFNEFMTEQTVKLTKAGSMMSQKPKEVSSVEEVDGHTFAMIRDHAKVFYFIAYKGKPADMQKAIDNKSALFSAEAGTRIIKSWMKRAIGEIKNGEELSNAIKNSHPSNK